MCVCTEIWPLLLLLFELICCPVWYVIFRFRRFCRMHLAGENNLISDVLPGIGSAVESVCRRSFCLSENLIRDVLASSVLSRL